MRQNLLDVPDIIEHISSLLGSYGIIRRAFCAAYYYLDLLRSLHESFWIILSFSA